MKIALILTILSGSIGMAAEPSTRPVAPRTPAVPIDRGTLIDAREPAFVPKFAKIDNPPAGQFAERHYAYRFTDPAPAVFGYGWGYGGYAYGFGYGSGGRSWGGTSSFYR